MVQSKLVPPLPLSTVFLRELMESSGIFWILFLRRFDL